MPPDSNLVSRKGIFQSLFANSCVAEVTLRHGIDGSMGAIMWLTCTLTTSECRARGIMEIVQETTTVSVILRYELRMRYLPKGYLSHFSEDKPSLNYLYHQVRQHGRIT